MPRSVNHVASKAKRTRILKLTKGYYGARKNVWTVAKNTWEKGLTYAYRDRRNKKRTFRALNSPLAQVQHAQAASNSIALEGPEAFAYADAPEHREGIAAVLQKRPPLF